MSHPAPLDKQSTKDILMDKEIIYVGDPMCSWCYGFTSVIQSLRAKFADRARFRLVMGGLRPDGTHVADQRYTAFLRGHWTEIQECTGQPFSLAILDRTGWIYDTEKACRAVVAMRMLRSGSEWDYFAAAQKGFYHHNHDPNDPMSFARIAERFSVDPDEFLLAYHGAAAATGTQDDFGWARDMGVNSFPTVLVHDARGFAALTIGYRPIEVLEGPLAGWLEG